MEQGLLWFDDDPGRDLEEKVGRAARHYHRKFGRRPNVCYVHPSLLSGRPQRVGKVQIAPKSAVLRHHFWVGEKDRSPAKQVET